jgi:hypothetical protein
MNLDNNPFFQQVEKEKKFKELMLAIEEMEKDLNKCNENLKKMLGQDIKIPTTASKVFETAKQLKNL